jgi:hypothetical protein
MTMKTCCDDGKRMTPYSEFVSTTPALPSFYWDVYSSEQRIKDMCKELSKLASYGTYLAETIDRIQAVSPEEFTAYQQEMRETIASLRTEIYELSVGVMSWNVQHGRFTSSIQAQRDMFNDLSVHALTIKKLNSLEMTVSNLANCGLSVRGLAVMSYWLVDKFDLSDDFQTKSANYTTNGILDATKLNVAKLRDDGTVFIPEEFRS